MSTFTMSVLDIDCTACATEIERILSGRQGITSAHVNAVSGEVEITCLDDGSFQLDSCAKALQRAGFRIPMEEYVFPLPENSAALAKIQSIFGVSRVTVRDKEADVICYPVGLSQKTFSAVLALYGEKGEVASSGGMADALPVQQADLLRRITAAFFLSLPVFFQMAGSVQMICTAAVLFGAGSLFFRGALRSLFSHAPNMDLLVTLSTTLIFAYSTAILIFDDGPLQLYYQGDCVLVLLLLFGRYLTVLAKGEAAKGVQDLLCLQPEEAVKILPDGTRQSIPAESVRRDDILYVCTGERIPADGIVLPPGSGLVDASPMTGESLPILVKEGDEVTGGTLLREGSFSMRVTGAGEESRLSRITEIVRKAQNSRTRSQDLADRIASVFIPAVFLTALAVFFLVFRFDPARLSSAVLRSCGVLVVACPCALGLAVPTSIMVGVMRGSEMGILFRSGEALERGTRIDTVCFDKTGTLTTGELSLQRVVTERDRDEILGLASGLEADSSHPAAKALRRAFQGALPMDNRKEKIGRGVSGTFHGKSYHLGSAAWMQELGIHVPEKKEPGLILFLAEDDRCIALLVFADTVRSDAAEAVKKLKERGLSVILLTGDRMENAIPAAKTLGISDVHAGLLPEQKVEAVRQLQKEGHRVLMAGDGINDAPPLSAADLSCAMGSGMDAAVDASQMVLTSGRVMDLPLALDLADAVHQNIRGNLVWALAYNVIAIPLAALGIINPSIAAAAMSISSIGVLMHALHLKNACRGEKR